ncbi:DNA sulfur modification protein DndD [Methanosarcina mazei]|uniref:Rad50/SbcC-type AAA domain-containing protein n=1 Tax=Methanosarcina mazei TaxID=2209 RepID=A0A0F8R0W3_METMZ|nr:DNA sulfur modification protein DndD [Methanosarcina mazei]KKF99593.1 hypothetical protein DU31_10255 [Methanosarcina mazei]KKG27612.1 hypothetical protein DU52_19035 [Methanosarcina mazei]KKG36624.1 hypothetical protein DU30_15235 [Methanosarcina mazei]KKH34854.1 hypothetical protein DU54_10200 [Methanosarcina mazei]KKH39150.1 hypothetical protein DU50_11110 [Methanosarcina mazei]
MIIKKLTIVNLGLFKGRHIFDLSPDVSSDGTKRPIILIGGKNGAGKTTLFESVLLCLYGPSYQGNKLREADYNKIISNKIHHITGTPFHTTNAYVEIELEYSHLGRVDQYVVKRSWTQESQKIKESLDVAVNEKLLNDLEVDQWQDFLNELIPPGISKMFFFDGEKIQHLAEDQENNGQLEDSFKALLGIDIVEKLKSDLRLYISRNSKELGTEEVQSKIDELRREINSLEEECEKLVQEKAQKKSYLDYIQVEIGRQELKLAHNGGTFASKRDSLKQESIQLKTEIINVENQIRELSHGLLPFALTPLYCKVLKERLGEEEEYLKWKATANILESKIKEVDDKIKSSELWRDVEISAPIQEELITKLSHLVLKTLAPSSRFEDYKPLHQLSSIEKQKIVSWIDLSVNETPAQMKSYTKKLEKLNSRLHSVEEAISRVPDDDSISPYVKKLNELNQELGQVKEQIETIDKGIKSTEFKQTECKRNYESQIEKIKKSEKLSSKLEIAGNVQNVIEEYILSLRKEKIKEFSTDFLKSFTTLARKENLIQKINIDEKDFSIVLYDSEGRKISKKQLSAGEKQIYAISMLWAFTLTSGRPLPFIIDTPLGRLDSDHRGTLINNFFPYASHQMIIFSTDTEVDQKYFKALSPFISKVYHLEYSPKERLTRVTEDYFWKNTEEEISYEV